MASLPKTFAMPRIFLMLLLLLAAAGLSAQQELSDFNHIRLQRQRTAMLVLGGWAVGNIVSGAALRGQRSGSDRHFHEMNIYWNAVNLGIAAFGYVSALRSNPAALGLYDSVSEHYGFQKILLLNAGLDVGYMLGGLYLLERGTYRPERSERLRGFGRSIILQGGFLLAFDLVNYFVQAGQNDRLELLLGAQEMGARLKF